MKENGLMERKMALEFGEDPKVIPTLGSGKTTKLMGMESIPGSMVIDMRENLLIASSMERECKNSRTGTHTKVSIKMEGLVEMENITGKMGVISKENSRMDAGTDSDSGNEAPETLINMKENI